MSYEQEVEYFEDDYGYDIEGIAEYEDAQGQWQPVDLTGAITIKIIIAELGQAAAKVVGTCTVIGDATNGEWKYTVQDGDFDEGDKTYTVNLLITYAGEPLTIGGAQIYIKERLPQTE